MLSSGLFGRFVMGSVFVMVSGAYSTVRVSSLPSPSSGAHEIARQEHDCRAEEKCLHAAESAEMSPAK
jgi:hypothetical protein